MRRLAECGLLLLLCGLLQGQSLPFPGPGTMHSAGGSGPCTGNFNRANGALGANWTNNLNSSTIASNVVVGTVGTDNLSSYTAQNLGTDHYAQVTLAVSSSDNSAPCVRMS